MKGSLWCGGCAAGGLSSLCRASSTGGSEGNTCRMCDSYNSKEELRHRARVEKSGLAAEDCGSDGERLQGSKVCSVQSSEGREKGFAVRVL